MLIHPKNLHYLTHHDRYTWQERKRDWYGEECGLNCIVSFHYKEARDAFIFVHLHSFVYSHFRRFFSSRLHHYNTYYQRGINAFRSKNSEKWRTQFHSFNWTPALRSLQSLWVRGNLTLDSSAKLSPPPLRSLSLSLSLFFFFFIFNMIMVKKKNLCHRLGKVGSKKFSWKKFSVEIGFRPFVYLFVATHDDEFYFNEKY